MKKYIIADKSFSEVKVIASAVLSTDHFVGGVDGGVELITSVSETYFDALGYTSEPFTPGVSV